MRVPLLLGAVALTAACTAGPDQPAAATRPGTAAPLRAAPPPPAASPETGRSTPTPRPAAAGTTEALLPVERGDGVLRPVPGGTSASGPGRTTPYVVEVEGGLGIDGAAFAQEVDRVLADPRSWGGSGRWALHRVAEGSAAFRVVLASPDTTDRLCAPLRTYGRFSCRNGELVVLNAHRWLTGAATYAGVLPRYREYLVNHEVGHALGQGHASCPAPGQPAPVMLQQTKGLDGCTRNPWPRP